MRYSKVVVALCIAVTTLYTLAVLALCFLQGALPPVELTTGVFAMYSVEFGALAVIKVKDAPADGRGGKEIEDE